jgi:uncharacterized HhH-GPD family protein
MPVEAAIDPPSTAGGPPRATIRRMTKKPAALPFTGDPDADALIARDPLALLIGYELDQQVTVQKAFSGPMALSKRLGGLDASAIASMDPSALEAAFREKPAIHRFPGTMAARVQDLCRHVASVHGRDAGRIWGEARDGAELEKRLLAVPGIGPMKAKSLIAVLANRFGVRPPGWEAVMPGYPTLGDVDSPEALAAYQEKKRAHKAAMKAAG